MVNRDRVSRNGFMQHYTIEAAGLKPKRWLLPVLLLFSAIIFSLFILTHPGFAETYVSGDVTSNTTWILAGSPYIVTGDITVRHPNFSYHSNPQAVKLTIEPGVEIRFNTGTGLYIGKPISSSGGYYGALLAQGTAESPITFTSNGGTPNPGDWKGIYFRNETSDSLSLLEHCLIEYGGHTHNANITFASANPPVQSSTVRYSSGHGIYLAGSSPDLLGNGLSGNQLYGIFCDNNSAPRVADNGFSLNGKNPLVLHPDFVRKVTGSEGTGNGEDAIEVRGGEITSSGTWVRQAFGYVITGDITVRHPNFSYHSNPQAVKLTIEPGVEIRFNSGTGLYIGKPISSSGGYYGALLAQGTAESPITFTSNGGTPNPGDWKGIYFRNETSDSLSLLEHCLIEYAGQGQNAGIVCSDSNPTLKFTQIRRTSGNGLHLNGGSPTVTSCQISENSDNGVYLEAAANPRIGTPGQGNTIVFNGSHGIYCEDANPDPIIEDNTISNNGSLPLRIGACMRVYRNRISDNASQIIAVVGEEITRNTAWYNNGVHFVVTGDITVRHPNFSYHSNPQAVKLTIEPGVEIRFNTGTGLYIGKPISSSGGYYGALLAQGTAESPITFTSNGGTPNPGDWKGIYFRNETSDSLSLLEHCLIEYGGHTHNANITFASANPPVQSSTVRYSSGHGIYLAGSSPDLLGNGLSGNQLYGIFCDNNSAPRVADNGFSLNGKNPLVLHPDFVRKVTGSEGTDNGEDAIEVRGGEITSSGTWVRQAFGYVITGDITVRHPNFSYHSNPQAVKLTIEPGVEIRFNSGTGLYIGKPISSSGGYYGALLAQGTAESPITFTSNGGTPNPGDWKGIYFRNETSDSLSLLEHCLIEYAGHTNNANIYLNNAKPTLEYNTIRNSSHSGIYVNGTGSNGAAINCNNLKDNHYGVYTTNDARPAITGNNFLRNLNAGVYSTSGVMVVAENNWWNDPNGANFNGDDTSGNVDFTPWLTAASDCVATPPTNTPPFAPKSPNPANGEVRVPAIGGVVTVNWLGGDPNPWDTVTYDVYFGDAADNLVIVYTDTDVTSVQMSGLLTGTTYYWRVVARDNTGGETSGPVLALHHRRAAVRPGGQRTSPGRPRRTWQLGRPSPSQPPSPIPAPARWWTPFWWPLRLTASLSVRFLPAASFRWARASR